MYRSWIIISIRSALSPLRKKKPKFRLIFPCKKGNSPVLAVTIFIGSAKSAEWIKIHLEAHHFQEGRISVISAIMKPVI